MRRRRVLQAVGATAAISAGCTGVSGRFGSPDDEDASSDGYLQAGWKDADLPASAEEYPTVLQVDGDPYIPPTDVTQIDSAVVGSRDGVDDAHQPHRVAVLNADASADNGAPDDGLAVGVRALDMLAGTVAFAAGYQLSSKEYIELELATPALYVIEVRTTTAKAGVRIPCHLFDCNRSDTWISLLAVDEFGSSTSADLLDCPTDPFEC